MPLSKEFLLGLGIDADTAKVVMTEHGKMQTTYIGQITTLEQSLANATSEKDKVVADLTQKNKDIEESYKKQIDNMLLANKTSALIDAAGVYDSGIVSNLIDVSDLNITDEKFDATYNERLGKLKTEKPFLFVPDKDDKPVEEEPKQEDQQLGGIRPGFVPGRNTQDKAPITTYTRVDGYSLPDITNIVNFDK